MSEEASWFYFFKMLQKIKLWCIHAKEYYTAFRKKKGKYIDVLWCLRVSIIYIKTEKAKLQDNVILKSTTRTHTHK